MNDWQQQQQGVPGGAITPGGGGYDPQDIENGKTMAILSYLGPLWLIAVILGRESAFTRFHLNQGLIMNAIWIVLWIPVTLVNVGIAFIPILGWIMAPCIAITFFLTYIAIAIKGAITANRGLAEELPVIGGLFKVF